MTSPNCVSSCMIHASSIVPAAASTSRTCSVYTIYPTVEINEEYYSSISLRDYDIMLSSCNPNKTKLGLLSTSMTSLNEHRLFIEMTDSHLTEISKQLYSSASVSNKSSLCELNDSGFNTSSRSSISPASMLAEDLLNHDAKPRLNSNLEQYWLANSLISMTSTSVYSNFQPFYFNYAFISMFNESINNLIGTLVYFPITLTSLMCELSKHTIRYLFNSMTKSVYDSCQRGCRTLSSKLNRHRKSSRKLISTNKTKTTKLKACLSNFTNLGDFDCSDDDQSRTSIDIISYIDENEFIERPFTKSISSAYLIRQNQQHQSKKVKSKKPNYNSLLSISTLLYGLVPLRDLFLRMYDVNYF
jgi:hypothetical protein